MSLEEAVQRVFSTNPSLAHITEPMAYFRQHLEQVVHVLPPALLPLLDLMEDMDEGEDDEDEEAEEVSERVRGRGVRLD